VDSKAESAPKNTKTDRQIAKLSSY